jgi:hypothetical protein
MRRKNFGKSLKRYQILSINEFYDELHPAEPLTIYRNGPYPSFLHMTHMETMTLNREKDEITGRAEFLDVGKVAKRLNVSTATVYDLFTTGDLPGRKVGKKWMTTERLLTDWFENSSTQSTSPPRHVKNDTPGNAKSAPPLSGSRVKRKVARKAASPHN